MKGFHEWEGRLLLCRHGEAQGNAEMVFMGSRDDGLTELGSTQAKGLASLLAHESIDHIWCSPLRRALDTAQALVSDHVEAKQDLRLKEQDFGLWEGLTMAQVRNRYPQDFELWEADAWTHGPSGGESLGEVTARVVSVLDELRPVSGTYALVAHAGCLQALICAIFGIQTRSTWPFRLINGSVSEIQFRNGFPTMTRLSATR